MATISINFEMNDDAKMIRLIEYISNLNNEKFIEDTVMKEAYDEVAREEELLKRVKLTTFEELQEAANRAREDVFKSMGRSHLRK